MKRTFRITGLIMLAAALIGCSGAPSGPSIVDRFFVSCGPSVEMSLPAWSPDSQHLIFLVTNGKSPARIGMVDWNGANFSTLDVDAVTTESVYWLQEPGSEGRIVFASRQDGPFEIYTIGAGAGLTRLTDPPDDNFHPVASPDGKTIVFKRGLPANGTSLYVMNSDGTQQVKITREYESMGDLIWSPDGKHIAYYEYIDPEHMFTVMDADGSHELALHVEWGNTFDLDWSPDGQRIAFVSEKGFTDDIYSIGINGTGYTQLTDRSEVAVDPDWSPDGKQIAFRSGPVDYYDIYVMNADGTHQTQLTATSGPDMTPAWSPDGKYIAFVSDRSGYSELFRMDADGKNQIVLAQNPANQKCFHWPF